MVAPRESRDPWRRPLLQGCGKCPIAEVRPGFGCGYRVFQHESHPRLPLSVFLRPGQRADTKVPQSRQSGPQQRVGVRILFDVIDHPPTESSDEGKPPLKLSKARVEFANVQFAYRPGEKVIRNLSFVAEPGNVTALVGPSGGGKSTILNLILRFYDFDSGAIIIDGQNIAAVSRRSLRSQVAYVGQDVFLFRGSV